MPARFIMLPSSAGDYVLDPEEIVYARAIDAKSSEVVLTGAVSITVTAPIDRVRETTRTLRMEARTEDQMTYFNHRHMVVASAKPGSTLLMFPNNTSAHIPEDTAETLLEALNRLDSEQDRT